MRIIKVLTFNLIFIIISILLVEYSYRKIYGISKFIPGATGKIEIKYDRKELNLLPRYVSFSTKRNRNNLTHIFNKRNKNFGCKILIIGGSTTEERILHISEKWTYKYFNEVNKNKIPDKCNDGIEVINAGVSGHSTWGNYADIHFWLKKELQESDLVIIYQGINDNHNGFSSKLNNFLNPIIGENLASNIRYYKLVLTSWLNYNSSIYFVLKELLKPKTVQDDFEISKRIANTQIVKLKKPENFIFSDLQKVYLDKSNIKKIENLSGYKDYVKISKKLYSDILKNGSSLIVINQTYPFCELTEERIIKYRDQMPSSNKSIKEEDIIDYAKNDLISNNFGWCLRTKLNSNAQKQAIASLSNDLKSKTKLIDYSKFKKMHLDEISIDLYHKDVNSSKILFEDLSKLGLINLTKKLISN